MKPLDLSKPLQTRMGHKIKIYSIEGVHPYVLHGAYVTPEGLRMSSWTAEGKNLHHAPDATPYDLINTPPMTHKVKGYIGVYNSNYGGMAQFFTALPSGLQRDNFLGFTPVDLEITEGEGL